MTALALRDDPYAVDLLGPAEKAEVIDALYKHFTMQKVSEATGYDLRRIMATIDIDDEFANAMALAEKHLSVIGEDELKRRAIHGVDSVVVANGRVVYQVVDGVRRPMVETKYSDSLLKTYLEANQRGKYGAKLEVTTTHRGHIALPTFSPEMMQLLLADARGEKLEFVVDDTLGADAAPEVVDAEFEAVDRPDMDTIRERVRAITTPRVEEAEFDIL